MKKVFSGNSVNILLVEDNPADSRLISEIFKDFSVPNELYIVSDGVKAMEFLHHEGAYSDVPRPDLIILDLNLPLKDGREVLAEVKQDDSLKSIPVVILTTSSNAKDIFDTYNHHASCFISKPVEFDQFVDIVGTIEDFWLTIVKLPPNHK